MQEENLQHGWLLRLVAGGLLANVVGEIILSPFVDRMIKIR